MNSFQPGNDFVAIRISEESHVSEARRQASRLASSVAFGETDVGRVALVTTEMGTNLVKHTPQGGELLAQLVEHDGRMGVEILALDNGPGILNVAEALRNGFSTGGGPGTGLGAVRRLSSYFDIYSRPDFGTALIAGILAGTGSAGSLSYRLRVGGIMLGKPGQPVSGDGWLMVQSPSGGSVIMSDGLGHGPDAADATRSALKTFGSMALRPVNEVLKEIHNALYHTRGAAVAAATIDVAQREVHFAGVGNISGIIASSSQSRHLISHNGTAGYNARKIETFHYPWTHEALLILHTDGLSNRWNLNAYPGLARRHPTLIAGVLYRDNKRGNDDVAVVVVRESDTG